MNEEKLKDLLMWALGENVGASSKFLCKYMLGYGKYDQWKSAPSDESDRARCIRLLDLMPEWWGRLSELAEISGDWKEQIPLIRREGQEA